VSTDVFDLIEQLAERLHELTGEDSLVEVVLREKAMTLLWSRMSANVRGFERVDVRAMGYPGNRSFMDTGFGEIEVRAGQAAADLVVDVRKQMHDNCERRVASFQSKLAAAIKERL
jgi:formylmethanofuran dehydrogenase subunit B